MNEFHYPRPDIAERALKSFDLGLFSVLQINARRRKGKTAFLLQDLARAAIKRGYLPIYASLWQEIDSPHLSLLQAFEESLEALQKKGGIRRLLGAKVRKAALKNELLGGLEIEFANNPTSAPSKELLKLDALLSQI